MASYRRIKVEPIAGALGAEISGIDLGALDDATFAEIKAAWLQHLVVFFRNQTIRQSSRSSLPGGLAKSITTPS